MVNTESYPRPGTTKEKATFSPSTETGVEVGPGLETDEPVEEGKEAKIEWPEGMREAVTGSLEETLKKEGATEALEEAAELERIEAAYLNPEDRFTREEQELEQIESFYGLIEGEKNEDEAASDQATETGSSRPITRSPESGSKASERRPESPVSKPEEAKKSVEGQEDRSEILENLESYLENLPEATRENLESLSLEELKEERHNTEGLINLIDSGKQMVEGILADLDVQREAAAESVGNLRQQARSLEAERRAQEVADSDVPAAEHYDKLIQTVKQQLRVAERRLPELDSKISRYRRMLELQEGIEATAQTYLEEIGTEIESRENEQEVGPESTTARGLMRFLAENPELMQRLGDELQTSQEKLGEEGFNLLQLLRLILGTIHSTQGKR